MKGVANYWSITPHIVLFKMKSQAEMLDWFLRPQEHIEAVNPEFRKRPFTVGEYIAWETEQAGYHDYWDRVVGVNFPGSVLKPFFSGLFDPLTEGEKILVNMLRSRTDNFYVIAFFDEQSPNDLEHEICHGLFYSEPSYRKSVLSILDQAPTSLIRHMTKILKEDYTKEVIPDEIHAYLATGYQAFFGKKFKPDQRTVDRLVANKRKWFSKLEIDVQELLSDK